MGIFLKSFLSLSLPQFFSVIINIFGYRNASTYTYIHKLDDKNSKWFTDDPENLQFVA